MLADALLRNSAVMVPLCAETAKYTRCFLLKDLPVDLGQTDAKLCKMVRAVQAEWMDTILKRTWSTFYKICSEFMVKTCATQRILCRGARVIVLAAL